MKYPFLERLRAWLPLLLPMLLLGATYWLNQQVMPLPAKSDPRSRHDIDFMIENVIATTLDEQGRSRFSIAAAKMWHFPDDQISHLEKARLVSEHPDGSRIVTTAENGQISRNAEEVFLRDDVRIVRSDQTTQSIFRTEFLHVLPKLDLAKTDREVILTDARRAITAVGMEMNFKTRMVSFLSNVKATHEPQ